MSSKRDSIEKWSLAYHILKKYIDFAFKFYFRTTIVGDKSIPKDEPIILAPNHQNALMDALAILVTRGWQPIFLARADIFEKPLYNKILTFLKIMPIFRIRDGVENLHKNNEIFNKTIQILQDKHQLVMLPEGRHSHKKQLLPLKKGITRIALQAQSMLTDNTNIHLVPVGIDYSNYTDVRSRVLVKYGLAINIKPMMADFKENPAKTYRNLLDLLERRLKDEMLHIEENKYYNVYTIILDLFTKSHLQNNNLKVNHFNIYNTQKTIIASLERYQKGNYDDFLLLASDALEYNMLLNRRKFSPEHYPAKGYSSLAYIPFTALLLLFLPLLLFSWLNNLIPFALAKYVSGKFKDKQFVSSARFVVGIIAIPINYIILITLFAIFSKSLLFTLIYTIALPLSLYYFFMYKRWFIKYRTWAREMRFRIFAPKRLVRLRELRENISEQMCELLVCPQEMDRVSL